MSGPHSFRLPLTPTTRRLAVVGAVLAGVVVAVALLSLRPGPGPVGMASTPSPSPVLTPAPLFLHTPMLTPGPLYLYTPSLPPTSTPTPTRAATPTPLGYTEPTAPPRVPGDFTTNAPLASAATWRSLTWRKLSVDDPLSAVRSVVRWEGGYLALGIEWAPDWEVTRNPVWVSSDGVSWRLLGPQVFGPTTLIAGIVEVRGRLVAVGTTGGLLGWSTGGIQAWTSTDGVAWAAESLPDLTPSDPDSNGAPLVAAGPAGVVVAVASAYGNADGTMSGSTLAAVSTDGQTWTPVGASAFPDNFSIGDLWGRGDGYVGVGSLGTNLNPSEGLALWSPDGTSWAPADGPIVANTENNPYGTPWGVFEVDAGSAGAVAVGSTNAAPNRILWWQASDGRHWTELPDYPPLGVYPGPGIAALLGPNGWLAAEGTRLVALREWADPAAWVSFDGASWSRVTISGDLPTGTGNPRDDGGCCQPSGIRVLPGGVLFSDGATTWYGAAAD